MQKWKVSDESVEKRLDVFLAQELPGLSRSSISKLIDQGKVTVNGTVEKPSYKLKLGQKLQLNYDLEKSSQAPRISLPILYEDEDCLVIDKPIGVLTHSKGAFNPEGTVATFTAPKLHGMEGERAGIVHRLDRATSGVIICAKTPDALKWLQKQFSQRWVKKTYVAMVKGSIEPSEAIIDVPIERNPHKPQTFRTGQGGKPAITNYKVIKQNDAYTMLELQPHTGRTHQLRVHLRHIGHPIVGDTLYGGEPASRLYLHAKTLEITLPSRERKIFEATLPSQFKAIMR